VSAWSALLDGFAVALTWQNLGWALAGCTLGSAVGVLPGIGPGLTVALLLPVIAKLDPTGSLIMLAGVYYGAMFGGSTTSILLNAPGESASIVTSMEGNLMAKQGRAGPALATAAIGSFVAGTLATLALTFVAPWVVDVALQFGPAEYTALSVLALVTVSSVLGSSLPRGLASLFLGVLIGLVGIDALTGQDRFTFGSPELLDGIDVVVVAVGLFAVGETLYLAAFLNRRPDTLERVPSRVSMSAEDWQRSWPAWLRGTVIGFPFGSIPAGGAEIPTFISYAVEKRLSRHSEEFGRGAIEGVAGPEAANNASATGTLVPLLTLGLPTSTTSAIMLAAFQQYGLQPGPLLFENQPGLVWGLIASLYVGNVMLLVLNLPLVGIWVKLLRIPRPQLYAGILVCATLGAYSLRQSAFDLLLLATVGLVGLAMRRFDFPVAPVIVGMILGPIAETQARRALNISQGDLSVFFTQPVAAALLGVAALALVAPRLWRRGVEGA
jgi:putative tricarboxylic transport membrane protein